MSGRSGSHADRFRVLITDAGGKHSIAIQRYLRAAMPEIYLTGHDTARVRLSSIYGYLDRIECGRSLRAVLNEDVFDMVIPVGAVSVQTVAEVCPQLALLPSSDSLECCFDKARTMALARSLEVPHPATVAICSLDELSACDVPYPCVLKPARETEGKQVYYAHNDEERRDFARRLFDLIGHTSRHGILIQEYVQGGGCGFFALYDNGRPVRVFMHKRLREYPVEGGASTAARAYYDETLKEYGLRILDELKWHGVAMVEFKHDESRDRFALMEINPKFWGSAELALRSGVNFGADMVRVYRGEKLTYCEDYNRDLHFYWPLDGDVLHLIKTRQLGKIRDYRQPNAATNLGQSRLADAWKTLRLIVEVLR